MYNIGSGRRVSGRLIGRKPKGEGGRQNRVAQRSLQVLNLLALLVQKYTY